MAQESSASVHQERNSQANHPLARPACATLLCALASMAVHNNSGKAGVRLVRHDRAQDLRELSGVVHRRARREQEDAAQATLQGDKQRFAWTAPPASVRARRLRSTASTRLDLS